MYAGLDFGTSNCSIGMWLDGSPRLIPLEDGDSLLPSAIFTEGVTYSVEKVDELLLEKKVRSELVKNKKYKKYKPEIEVRATIRSEMRKEASENVKKLNASITLLDALKSDAPFYFGRKAIKSHQYYQEINQHFMKSPKSFLGSDICASQKDIFRRTLSKLFNHIKNKAELYSNKSIDSIVIGRPVNFHGMLKEDGNLQAVNILRDASNAAGFKNIEFMIEPIAAGLNYERNISKDLNVLILDIGGGTTDVSMIKLGPSYITLLDRTTSVMGSAGHRIGGVDIDIKLAYMNVMPFFGKNGLLKNGKPIPYYYFSLATQVNDFNAQKLFLSESARLGVNNLTDQTLDIKIERLNILYEKKLALRLINDVEQAKIALSTKKYTTLLLPYIDEDLSIVIREEEIIDLMNHQLNQIIILINDVINQASVKPDVVYLTGGSAKSPLIRNWVRSHFKDIDVEVGDEFSSVTSGLTTWAHRIFR